LILVEGKIENLWTSPIGSPEAGTRQARPCGI
jgi:hypothetical protein